jgi:hypothetical protein
VHAPPSWQRPRTAGRSPRPARSLPGPEHPDGEAHQLAEQDLAIGDPPVRERDLEDGVREHASDQPEVRVELGEVEAPAGAFAGEPRELVKGLPGPLRLRRAWEIGSLAQQDPIELPVGRRCVAEPEYTGAIARIILFAGSVGRTP